MSLVTRSLVGRPMMLNDKALLSRAARMKNEICPCSVVLAVPVVCDVIAGVSAAMTSYADACKADGSGTSESTLSPARLGAWGSCVVVA